MSSPNWLSEAASVWDSDGDRWVIRSIGAEWVEIGNTDRGVHRILRSDLVDWVEDGEWSTED